MKIVFDNPQVAHVWAQQTQATGRSSNGNLYFRDSTLYSYRDNYPIAVILSRGDAKFCLINGNGYSISTGRHISYARSAASHIPQIEIPDLQDLRGNFHDLPHVWKQAKLLLTKELASLLAKRKRAKKHTEWHDRHIGHKLEGIKAFLAFAGIEDSINDASIAAALAETEQMNKENAARERECAKVEKQRKAAWFEAMRGYANDWQNGGPDTIDTFSIGQWHNYGGETLLRLKDHETIETSRGAEFPVDHAKRAWPLLVAIVKSGTAWERNGHKIPLGHFQIDKVSAKGTITAGCHIVVWEQVQAIAAKLGLT